MPKRSRFIRAEKRRILLADVHRQLHQDLISKGVAVPGKPDTFRPATPDEIAASRERVEQAEADGDWIDVKKELTAGEQREMFIGLIKDRTMHEGEKANLDPALVGVNSLLSYLLGWSFVDDDGEPVPYSLITMAVEERLATILRLDPEDYQELDRAIDLHMAAMAAEKAALKKTRITPAISAPTS